MGGGTLAAAMAILAVVLIVIAVKGAGKRDEYPRIRDIPQKKPSYARDLALLAPDLTCKARIRLVVQNGVMIQFVFRGRRFEGIAPFSGMSGSFRHAVHDNQPVTIRVVVPRDDNWGIPLLEIVSIDGQTGA